METLDAFALLDMRIGRIVRAERFPEARKPAYKLWIDFGDRLGVKTSSAQITERYRPEELLGRLVVAVVNFPPKRIAGFVSEVLVLGVPDDRGAVVLLRPDADVPLGAGVF
ncbi:MAG: tRNA-binding protein [Chlorobi bacterium]|jgi:tRNA-binding protein|nr:tRNA-binding protein [Chlorobiota bacterium]